MSNRTKSSRIDRLRWELDSFGTDQPSRLGTTATYAGLVSDLLSGLRTDRTPSQPPDRVGLLRRGLSALVRTAAFAARQARHVGSARDVVSYGRTRGAPGLLGVVLLGAASVVCLAYLRGVWRARR